MPFPAEQACVSRIGHTLLNNDIDGIGIDCAWSPVGGPALAMPAGFSRGLPVGLQLLARPRGEAALFAIAAWIERELDSAARPLEPRR